jgi:hypothetical protein
MSEQEFREKDFSERCIRDQDRALPHFVTPGRP